MGAHINRCVHIRNVFRLIDEVGAGFETKLRKE
jgi:hypothetical protein